MPYSSVKEKVLAVLGVLLIVTGLAVIVTIAAAAGYIVYWFMERFTPPVVFGTMAGMYIGVSLFGIWYNLITGRHGS